MKVQLLDHREMCELADDIAAYYEVAEYYPRRIALLEERYERGYVEVTPLLRFIPLSWVR